MRLRIDGDNISIMVRYCLLFLIMIMMFALQGCGDSNRQRQVTKTVAQIKARSPAPIKPLPVIKPLGKATYHAHNLRDPFSRPQLQNTTRQQRPDLERPKEALEAFPLDALKMVGTIKQNGKIWALIKAPDGAVHPVAVGNYLGKHFGRITKTTATETELTESIQMEGKWQKRKTTLTMNDEQ